MEGIRFSWLFGGLLLLLLLVPLLHSGGVETSAALEGALTSLLLVGAWGLRTIPRWFFVALGLATVNLVAIALFLWSGDLLWSFLSVASLLAFCVLSAIVAIRFILAHSTIDMNHLIGALSVYLLLGVIWALLFELLRLFDADALLNVAGAPGQPGASGELLYFSYVTLTTVGYGDVSPSSPLARSLAVLEAVVGQLFLAVLIASLIGRIGRPATKIG